MQSFPGRGAGQVVLSTKFSATSLPASCVHEAADGLAPMTEMLMREGCDSGAGRQVLALLDLLFPYALFICS